MIGILCSSQEKTAGFVRTCLSMGALLTLLLIPSLATAGPWSRDTGRFYVKLSQGFLWSSDTADPAQPGTPYFGTTTAFYGEVGLFYGLQAMAFLPFTIATHSSRTNPNEAYAIGSLGDANFGLQWTPPPLQKLLKFPIALRVDFKVPLYDTQMAKNITNIGSKWSKFPFIGDGQLDVTFTLSAGGGIPNTNLYIFGEAGYRVRTAVWSGTGFSKENIKFGDSFTFQLQAGYNIMRRVLVMVNFAGVIPFDSSNLFTKGFVLVGVGLYVPVWKGLAVEASFDPVVYSIRSDRAISFNLGLSYSY